jgi:putative effector of murein hydrolase
MKEAAGEANMTVVTIILIGVIVAVATPIITSMMNNTSDRAECMNNGGCWDRTSSSCDYDCKSSSQS